MPLPRCFFDIAINGVPSGRIIFELFKDDCPKTVENFRCLCTGERGEGRTTFKPLFYRGSPIHRIVKGFIIQGGDFSKGDGTGGESIYGGMFKDEGFKHKHDQPFLLSMANKGPNTNGSQFFITTRPSPHLDGIHVVFGRVMSGIPFATEIENQKVDVNHRPYADVRITHSGELVIQKKAKKVMSSEGESSEEVTSSGESSSESESETEEEKRRKKRRLKKKLMKEEARRQRKKKKRSKDKTSTDSKKKKRAHHKKKSKKYESSGSGSESEASHSDDKEPIVTSTVPELEGDEVPPELKSGRPSWLYRKSRTPSPRRMEIIDTKKKEKLITTRQPAAAAGYKPMFVSRKNEVSQSGRKLKGRGTMRYRTPPRFGNGDDDLRNELQSNDRKVATSRAWSPPPRQQRSPARSGDLDHAQHDYRGGGGGGGGRAERSPPRRYQERNERRDYPRGRWRNDSRERDGGRQRDGSRSPRGNKTGGGQRDRSQSPRGDKKGGERKEGSRSPGGANVISRLGGTKRGGSLSGSDEKSRRRRRFKSRSRSPGMEQRRRGKSRSRSRSPGSRMRSSRRRSGGEGGDRSRRKASNRNDKEEKSKWSRHRDGSSSSSEDDKELERAFQQHKQGMEKEGDVFGLNKLLS